MPRRIGVRAYLVLLVLGTVVPVVFFAVVMVQRHARLDREAIESNVRDGVRALTLAVDRELARTQ